MLLNFIFHLREDRDRLLELSGTFRWVWKAVAILMNRNISLSQQSPWNKQVCRYAPREYIKTHQNISIIKTMNQQGLVALCYLCCTRFFQIFQVYWEKNTTSGRELEFFFCLWRGKLWNHPGPGYSKIQWTKDSDGDMPPKKDDGITGSNIVTPN